MQRELEDGGIGLRRPSLGRRYHEIEVMPDSDVVHVGIAVGNRPDCVPLAQLCEHARHVVEEGDGVAVLPEHAESGFCEIRSIAPLLQQRFEPSHASAGEVVADLGDRRIVCVSVGDESVVRVGVSDVGAGALDPFVELRLGVREHRP